MAEQASADVTFSLDFPIPPSMELKEARKRQRLTIANAHWALENRRRRDLPLYVVVQAWDADSPVNALELMLKSALMVWRLGDWFRDRMI